MGEYINPLSAANNQQLSTSANSPAKGWTFSAADTVGYYICTAEGGIQLHQANSGMGHKIINCGSGTNTSDAECQFKVNVVDIENIPSYIEAVYSVYSDSISDSEDVVIYDMLGRRFACMLNRCQFYKLQCRYIFATNSIRGYAKKY